MPPSSISFGSRAADISRRRGCHSAPSAHAYAAHFRVVDLVTRRWDRRRQSNRSGRRQASPALVASSISGSTWRAPAMTSSHAPATTASRRRNCGSTRSIIVAPVTAVELPLLQRQAYVDGTWVDADSGETFPVVNPATGEVIAEVPRMGAAETRRALAAAERALPDWKARTAKDRARVLRRLADLMLEHEDDLARLMVTEQGKPLAEARVEVQYAASFYEWFGEEAKRVYGDTIPCPWPDKRIHVTKEPVGVTAGITPWNFPAAMPTRKSAPALAAGCTMVLKPAEQTPLSRTRRRRARGGGRRAGRRLLRRHGCRRGRAGDRRRDDLEPGCAQARLHGLDRGREAPHGAVRARAQEDLARARRQRAVHRLRRRRPRGGGRGRDHVQVPQLGADLHLGESDARAGGYLRRLRRTVHGGRRARSRSPTGSRKA